MGAKDVIEVPLFPLPNIVLFPRAVLPLHIFEERYKEMTADVLAGSRQVAMAMLRPGWEKSYYGRPQIEPVICVGTILSHERLADGNYNFLLQGHTRARIVREIMGDKPYRRAQVQTLPEVPAPAGELAARRVELEKLAGDLASASPCASQLDRLMHSTLQTPEIADLIAFSCIDDVWLKQSLLAEADVLKRVTSIIEQLKVILARARNEEQMLHRASLN